MTAVRLGLVGDDDGHAGRGSDQQAKAPDADTLSIEETAKELDVSVPTVYRMIADGRLAAIKHARRTRIKPAAIADYHERIRTEAERRRQLAARRASAPLPPLPSYRGNS